MIAPRAPWRASPARGTRIPPVGFVRPCEPTLVDRPPAGASWLHEVKHDGFRILVRKLGERAKVWSRCGADFTDRFPAIAEAVGGLSVGRALIDGEAVALMDDGRSDFHALLTKRGERGASLVGLRPSVSRHVSETTYLFLADNVPLAELTLHCRGTMLAKPAALRSRKAWHPLDLPGVAPSAWGRAGSMRAHRISPRWVDRPALTLASRVALAGPFWRSPLA
jgi:hypothetical protein